MAELTMLDKFADRLAATIDIPLLPEVVEPWALRLAFRFTLGEIEKRKPEYIGWIKSAADGIDDSEAASVQAWVVELMDEYGASVPSFLRGVVAGAIVNVIRKGAEIVLE